MAVSFPMLGKFSAIISLYFLRPFLSLFSFWDSYHVNVGVFNVVLKVSKTVLISFNSFFLILSTPVISSILSSSHLSVLLLHLFC